MNGSYRMQLPDTDPGSWGGYIVQLVGAGGIGFLLRELVKQVFARANKGDDTATVARGELRQQIADLIARQDVLEQRLDAARDEAHSLFVLKAELHTENTLLRNRYHRLLGYAQELVTTIDIYAERFGVPVHERPRVPRWIDETVPGPTARDAAPKPPEGA